MSYSFDGSNDRMTGSFTGTYAVPVTIACWVKAANHPVAADIVAMLGNGSASQNNSVSLRTTATDDNWAGGSANNVGTTILAGTGINNIDNTWTPFVTVKTSNTLLDAYLINIATTGQNTTGNVVAGALQFISLAESLAGTGDFAGKIAEFAIWDKALTADEITSYMAGTAASSIAAADLIGYWPLSADNATQSNLGVDSGGNLTVANAVFDADHPTITTGGTTITPNPAVMSV